MSDPAGLLITAGRLLIPTPVGPSQSDLRRAISTAYYALFHAICASNADCLTGSRDASERAWLQVYRALEHGTARIACQHVPQIEPPPDLVLVAQAFVALQAQRHMADYDPAVVVSHRDGKTAVVEAELAIEALSRSSPADRTTFALHLLLRRSRS